MHKYAYLYKSAGGLRATTQGLFRALGNWFGGVGDAMVHPNAANSLRRQVGELTNKVNLQQQALDSVHAARNAAANNPWSGLFGDTSPQARRQAEELASQQSINFGLTNKLDKVKARLRALFSQYRQQQQNSQDLVRQIDDLTGTNTALRSEMGRMNDAIGGLQQTTAAQSQHINWLGDQLDAKTQEATDALRRGDLYRNLLPVTAAGGMMVNQGINSFRDWLDIQRARKEAMA